MPGPGTFSRSFIIPASSPYKDKGLGFRIEDLGFRI